jgi:SAM-dependent methyltransferase
MFESGEHPTSYSDLECEFATGAILQERPTDILDIGSYRQFLIGLMAGFRVTTIDVRERRASSQNEVVMTADAKLLPFPDASFQCVLSLCALEHFGLGRYGDEFDPDGDLKAAREMTRVLRPGGVLIISTTITQGQPTIAFNAHRIYDKRAIDNLLSGLRVEKEAYVNTDTGFCSYDQVDAKAGLWNVYCGLWRKG